MDKQQGPTEQHRELYQYPMINHNGKEKLGKIRMKSRPNHRCYRYFKKMILWKKYLPKPWCFFEMEKQFLKNSATNTGRHKIFLKVLYLWNNFNLPLKIIPQENFIPRWLHCEITKRQVAYCYTIFARELNKRKCFQTH